MGGPQDFVMITADQAQSLAKVNSKYRSLTYWRSLAKKTGVCQVCEENPIWRFADTGLCFPCTTGESDASEDFELQQE